MKKTMIHYLWLSCIILSSGYIAGAASTASPLTKSGKYYGYHLIRIASGGLLLIHHYDLWMVPLGKEIGEWLRNLQPSSHSQRKPTTQGTSKGSSLSSGGSKGSLSCSSSKSSSSVSSAPSLSQIPRTPWRDRLMSLLKNAPEKLKNAPRNINTTIGNLGEGVAELASDLVKEVGVPVMKHGAIQLGVCIWSHLKIKEMERLSQKP